MENWQLAFSTFHNFLPSLRKHVPTCQEHAAAEAEWRENLTVIDKVERALLVGSMFTVETTPFIFFWIFFFNRFYSGSRHFASPDLNTAGKRRLRSSLTTIQLKFSGALKPNCSGTCYGAQRAWKQNIKHENKTNPQLCSLVIGLLELLSCIAEYLHTLRVNNEQAEVGQEGCSCLFNRFTCHNSNNCGKNQTNKKKRPFLTIWMNVSSVYLLLHAGATASRSR